MNRSAGVLKMYYRDKLSWFHLPWGILTSSFVVNLIVAYFITAGTSVKIHVTGGIASIFIYVMVIGIVTLSQTFPYVLGSSIRRKDYFWGTTAMIVAFGLFTSIALTVLGVVEERLTAGWGVGLQFFDLPYLSDGHVLEQMSVYFSLLVHCFFYGFLIACFFRRYRRTGLYVAACVLLAGGSLLTYLMTYYNGWVKLYEWFIQYTMSQHALWIVATAVLYALLSYFMLRKSTI